MKKSLKSFLRKQAFEPGLPGMVVNPFYFARRGLYVHVRQLSAHISGRILDVGCGSKPYKHLFKFTEYVGMDIENPGHSHQNEHIDLYYDGKTFPLQEGTFDSVICSQVLEHVFTADAFLQEINRVLKKDGMLLLTVPFVWDEHEQPNDFARYSSFGLRDLLTRNGFTIVQHIKSVNNLAVIFQLFNAYIHKKVLTRGKIPYYLGLLLLVFPANLMGTIVKTITPANKDLYLDNIVLARKQ